MALAPREHERVEEVVRLVTELYGGALERVLEVLGDDHPAVVRALLDDELVGGLLAAHDLELEDPAAAVASVPVTIGRQPRRPSAGERCELCGEPIGDEHPHVVDVDQRALHCACRGCWLLFTADGAGGGHLRAVPDRYVSFPGLRIDARLWDALQIPVSVAFFFVSSPLGRVASLYPSPAGATESLLPLDAWADLLAAEPGLGTLVPDVEALLVRTGRDGSAEVLLVPIDVCYELVGTLRRTWRGFDGGQEARAAINELFERVGARARPLEAARP